MKQQKPLYHANVRDEAAFLLAATFLSGEPFSCMQYPLRIAPSGRNEEGMAPAHSSS